MARNSVMSRREFLRFATALGGATALASVLEGCSSAGVDPQAAISPTAVPETATRAGGLAATPTYAEPTAASTRPAPSAAAELPGGKAGVAFVKTTDRAGGQVYRFPGAVRSFCSESRDIPMPGGV